MLKWYFWMVPTIIHFSASKAQAKCNDKMTYRQLMPSWHEPYYHVWTNGDLREMITSNTCASQLLIKYNTSYNIIVYIDWSYPSKWPASQVLNLVYNCEAPLTRHSSQCFGALLSLDVVSELSPRCYACLVPKQSKEAFRAALLKVSFTYQSYSSSLSVRLVADLNQLLANYTNNFLLRAKVDAFEADSGNGMRCKVDCGWNGTCHNRKCQPPDRAMGNHRRSSVTPQSLASSLFDNMEVMFAVLIVICALCSLLILGMLVRCLYYQRHKFLYLLPGQSSQLLTEENGMLPLDRRCDGTQLPPVSTADKCSYWLHYHGYEHTANMATQGISARNRQPYYATGYSGPLPPPPRPALLANASRFLSRPGRTDTVGNDAPYTSTNEVQTPTSVSNNTAAQPRPTTSSVYSPPPANCSANPLRRVGTYFAVPPNIFPFENRVTQQHAPNSALPVG